MIETAESTVGNVNELKFSNRGIEFYYDTKDPVEAVRNLEGHLKQLDEKRIKIDQNGVILVDGYSVYITIDRPVGSYLYVQNMSQDTFDNQDRMRIIIDGLSSIQAGLMRKGDLSGLEEIHTFALKRVGIN